VKKSKGRTALDGYEGDCIQKLNNNLYMYSKGKKKTKSYVQSAAEEAFYQAFSSRTDIEDLQQKVIQSDSTGEWCYRFAFHIPGVDIKKLQARIIEVDEIGQWCVKFALSIKGADIAALMKKRIEKACIDAAMEII
jgi:hypothetical protein